MNKCDAKPETFITWGPSLKVCENLRPGDRVSFNLQKGSYKSGIVQQVQKVNPGTFDITFTDHDNEIYRTTDYCPPGCYIRGLKNTAGGHLALIEEPTPAPAARGFAATSNIDLFGAIEEAERRGLVKSGTAEECFTEVMRRRSAAGANTAGLKASSDANDTPETTIGIVIIPL